MHLPLSAGNVVMLWASLGDVTAFFSCVVRLDRTFPLEKVTEIFNLIWSVSVFVNLLILITVLVAVVRFTIGSC